MAGVLGVHPGPYTMVELDLMYGGRSKFHWDIASNVLCMLAEVNRNHKKRSSPFQPREFHPHYKNKRKPGKSLSEAIDILEAQAKAKPTSCPPRRS